MSARNADEALARLDALTPCMEHMLHSGGFCNLPYGHRGPHGWDYENQRLAVITRRQSDRDLRAAGMGALADRLNEAEEESR